MFKTFQMLKNHCGRDWYTYT